MLRQFTMALEDGWDSAHVLTKPGSQEPSLCGHRPTIVWRRIWVEVLDSHERIPGCARCIAKLTLAATP